MSAQAIAELERRLDDTESARRRADDARDHVTEDLDAARADLQARTEELAAARGDLRDAREQITELNDRFSTFDEQPE